MQSMSLSIFSYFSIFTRNSSKVHPKSRELQGLFYWKERERQEKWKTRFYLMHWPLWLILLIVSQLISHMSRLLQVRVEGFLFSTHLLLARYNLWLITLKSNLNFCLTSDGSAAPAYYCPGCYFPATGLNSVSFVPHGFSFSFFFSLSFIIADDVWSNWRTNWGLIWRIKSPSET